VPRLAPDTGVHTDEYEIALSRELGVCTALVKRCRRLLERLEARHGMTTAEFLARRQGALPGCDDVDEWLRASEELQRWSAARDEYERLLAVMKVSAPAGARPDRR
jgi:hypothetical protein